MSPSAIPPTTTSGLTAAGVESTLQHTAPSEAANNNTNESASPPLTELDASLCTTTLTTAPRPVPAPNSPEVYAQKTCTDHMITVSWTASHGWHTPELKPYGPLSLMPTASVLHYATECFEGQKLYRGHDGALRLFRPDCNAARMLVSATRIALPGFAPAELQKLVMKLCAVDGAKWLPRDRPGSFLYIRPTLIGNDPTLGVQQPKEALLYIILACFPNLDVSVPVPGPSPSPSNGLSTSTGADAPTQAQPQTRAQIPGLKLLASRDDMVRAWPGGFGFAKVGANYGPSLLAQAEARRAGFDQILWLFGAESLVTEAGASNFFVVWRTRDEGRVQLVTAPLGGRIILDGVTRRSVLQLARERLVGGWEGGEERLEKVEVVEREFSMSDLVEASEEGRLVEAFAAGTAFFIAPVSRIQFRGRELNVPLATGDSGKYARVVKTWLRNIMYGKEKHEWGVVVEEESA